jgi:hypothetical protein
MENYVEDYMRYLEEIVEPTVKEFEENPTSVRRAFLACVAVFHAVDYLAYQKTSKANLRGKLRSQSPDFAIVDKVAHAFKHVVAGDPNNPNLKANEVISRPGGLSTDGVSFFSVVKGGVVLSNDPNVVVLDTVKRAVDFLRKQAETNNQT